MKLHRRILAIVLGVLLGGASAEGLLRVRVPDGEFGGKREIHHFRRGGAERFESRYVVDPDFGFRPILGSSLYNEHGTQLNEYSLEKRPGVTRLLFAGDSVTARGKIVTALRERLGEARFEYWNGGVESYSITQVVNYYEQFTSSIEPDHVVVTLHVNDYQTTPVTFLDDDGEPVVFAPTRPRRVISSLYRYAYLYRWYIGATGGEDDHGAIADEVRASLARLRDVAAAQGARLTVLPLPVFRPEDEWVPAQRKRYDSSCRFLEELEIRYFELREPLAAALAAGVNVQEKPGDATHPSPEVSGYFADYLIEAGLFSAAGDG